MDEILKNEADYDEETETSPIVRAEVIETIFYQRALRTTQKAMEDGYPFI